MRNNSVLALGSFDGVHLGHRALIKKCVDISLDKGSTPLVYCFSQSPQQYFGNFTPQILSSDEKYSIIDSLGCKVVIDEFTKDIETTTAEDFITWLVDRFSPSDIVVGYNYRFGHKAEGNSELLSKYGKIYDFKVHTIDAVIFDSEPVSSTRIRDCLESGNIIKANKMLGYDFFYSGTVKPRKHLLSKLGLPTLKLNNVDKIIPKKGVYISYVQKNIDEEKYLSVTNVGTRPSVLDSDITSIETHVLEELDDLYGEVIYVKLIEFVREEKKFATLGELKINVEIDIEYAKEYWSK